VAKEAEIIPFPREEETPPVTKMYLVKAMMDTKRTDSKIHF
jgi:hypothetical protein